MVNANYVWSTSILNANGNFPWFRNLFKKYHPVSISLFIRWRRRWNLFLFHLQIHLCQNGYCLNWWIHLFDKHFLFPSRISHVSWHIQMKFIHFQNLTLYRWLILAQWKHLPRAWHNKSYKYMRIQAFRNVLGLSWYCNYFISTPSRCSQHEMREMCQPG